MKTEPTISIQDEIAKIHVQYGTTEMANYRIEKLLEKYIEQSSPKIKQLEWRYDEEFFIWEANSVFGKYSFVDNSLIVNKKLFFRGKEIAIVLTIDEAKSAAQRDFEKRIKECLDI